jgi:hypothetical protein
MHVANPIRIESLGKDPLLCVLRDRHGDSLGTGSREVLEVLLYIAKQYDTANLYYGRRWHSAQPILHHVRQQYA